MPYRITEADTDSPSAVAAIHRLNSLAPEIFPPLSAPHLENGFWWFAYMDGEVVAFAGLVPFDPFPRIGYIKRAFVMPDHRGHQLQARFLRLREEKSKQLGWTHLVSDCSATNQRSAHNFRMAGFAECQPEQRWAGPSSIYWIKTL